MPPQGGGGGWDGLSRRSESQQSGPDGSLNHVMRLEPRSFSCGDPLLTEIPGNPLSGLLPQHGQPQGADPSGKEQQQSIDAGCSSGTGTGAGSALATLPGGLQQVWLCGVANDVNVDAIKQTTAAKIRTINVKEIIGFSGCQLLDLDRLQGCDVQNPPGQSKGQTGPNEAIHGPNEDIPRFYVTRNIGHRNHLPHAC